MKTTAIAVMLLAGSGIVASGLGVMSLLHYYLIIQTVDGLTNVILLTSIAGVLYLAATALDGVSR